MRFSPSPSFQSVILLRALHTSKPRRDVFFLSIPAIKSGLLGVTRFSLLFLPFVFRYKWVVVGLRKLTPGCGRSTSALRGF